MRGGSQLGGMWWCVWRDRGLGCSLGGELILHLALSCSLASASQALFGVCFYFSTGDVDKAEMSSSPLSYIVAGLWEPNRPKLEDHDCNDKLPANSKPVWDLLFQLHAYKSMGPTGIHPRVL